MRSRTLSKTLAALGSLTLLASIGVAAAPAASAATVDGATAKGRATGSGKWGYVGQFGQLNKTSEPAIGQFVLPYGLDIRDNTIAVTDSGQASWESGSKVVGHSIQTFALTVSPGSAGHGDYIGNGQYDIVADKSGSVDPGALLSPQAIKYLPQGAQRGPRGATLKADGSLVYSTYDNSGLADAPMLFKTDSAALGTPVQSWGSVNMKTAGAAPGPVHLDSDASENTYVATNEGIKVFAPDGTLLSSMGLYFDADGVSQASRVGWSTRAVDVPKVFNDPKNVGEAYGVSLVDHGTTIDVYVGEAGGYYQPDYKVHFPNGATTAENLNRGSITKFIVTKSGGKQDARYNPSAWKWTLDTSFADGGAYYPGGDTLADFLGRPFFQGQTPFALQADATSGQLFFALNGVSGPKIGALDLATGAASSAPAAVNAPSTQQDSAMGYVRGLATDSRGLLYAATQATTAASNARAVVQIWGKTPTPIADTATANPALTTAELNWGESTVGHQQPDLLDYTVKYRKVGETAWLDAPSMARAATSTETSRTLAGLAPATSYEALITPWNEAGSGDPARVTFTTDAETPALTLTKTGNGTEAPTAVDAVHVDADSTVDFEYTVKNTGNTPLTGVAVTDDKIAALTPPAGFDGTLAPGASAAFTASGPVPADAYVNTATATSDTTNPVTALWHGVGDTRGVSITKTGNGAAAPTKDEAITVPAGSSVDFEYTVTNTGNTKLTDVAVEDDQIAALTPPVGFDGTLAAGASAVFTASGPVAAGDYKNTATVTTAEGPTDAAAWNGFGASKGLAIVKKGNDTVATTADTAVRVPAGSTVAFSYEVTNIGNAPVSGVSVKDDQIADVAAPEGFDGILAAGESVTFTASGPVGAGEYKNTATASTEETEDATTVWNGFGTTAKLSIVKKGAGSVATTADDAVHVDATSTVIFTYEVTNEGNAPLHDVVVNDDKISEVAAPAGFEGTLQPGESATFTASGPVAAGEYKNTATATSEEGAKASTEWHGFGDAPALSVVKKGNGTVAAEAADAVKVPAGTDVEFSYEVKNTGNSTLTGVKVTDDQIANVTAPAGFDGTLAPGESVVFTATGAVPAGTYVNTATASADQPIEASAKWHGLGEVKTTEPTDPTNPTDPTTPPTSEPTVTDRSTIPPTSGTSDAPVPPTALPSTGLNGAGTWIVVGIAALLALGGATAMVLTRRRH